MKRVRQGLEIAMQKIPADKVSTEKTFAARYRGLQLAISTLTGDPQPPCYFCLDHQIWNCSRSGRECDMFTRYYSNFDL